MSKLYAGARINALRRSQKLTQAALAKKLDLSTSYLNQLENDGRPLTATVLLQLMDVFDVEASYFSPDRNTAIATRLAETLAINQGPTMSMDDLLDFTDRFPQLAQHIIQPADVDPTHSSAHDFVRDYFSTHKNHIDSLDRLGEELAAVIGQPGLRVTRFAQLLDDDYNITVRFRASDLSSRRHFDPLSRQILLRQDLTEAQQCFQLAEELAFLAHSDLLDTLTTDQPELPTEAAVRLAKVGLSQYFAAALVMPYTRFLNFARDKNYDIDLISEAFGVSFESACHRLSTLQRLGAEGIPFFFVRSDRAGNISKRQSAATFHFSRTDGTCPLWALHRAFERQGDITRQVARMPDGRTYLWIARSVKGRTHGFGNPVAEFAIGLGCDISEAPGLVYSQGLNLDPESAAQIGPGCRICPRENCVQRAFPPSGKDSIRPVPDQLLPR
ncbi:transcriptional regulator [Corynebacterium suranareeae]|uniref:Transcriptional regulator n=1 Tax=Corynebacterium suranareeae TaxID=2506452 RepID=A0A160PQS8_9CORY|nr:helix-turn-helix transcriptional regulator [Corynebacterium suranareeae]BAU95091.1 transcriptional regulator [Corynebacterium suranareeae]